MQYKSSPLPAELPSQPLCYTSLPISLWMGSWLNPHPGCVTLQGTWAFRHLSGKLTSSLVLSFSEAEGTVCPRLSLLPPNTRLETTQRRQLQKPGAPWERCQSGDRVIKREVQRRAKQVLCAVPNDPITKTQELTWRKGTSHTVHRTAELYHDGKALKERV